MDKNCCSTCTRSFASRQALNYHIDNLKKPCTRPEHYCGTCNKGFSSARSLWQHKKICKGVSEIRGNDVSAIPYYEKLSEIPDYDTTSEVSLDTANRIINKDTSGKRKLFDDVPSKYGVGIADNEPTNDSVQSNESDNKSEDEYKLFDSVNMKKIPTIDDIEKVVRGNEEMKDEDQPLNFSEDSIKDDESGDEIQKELDEEDVEKVLPEFIEARIEESRKRLMELLKKEDGNIRLVDLIDQFLNGDMTVNKETEDIFRTLKNTTATVEMEMLVKHIADEKERFTEIFRRFDEADDSDDIPVILKSFAREHKISQKAFEKLIKITEDEDLTLPALVNILKEFPHRHDDMIKGGNGVTYLPGSTSALHHKLSLLLAEYEAGNTTTSEEIIAILDRLLERNVISDEEYQDYCRKITGKGIQFLPNSVKELFGKLKFLAAEFITTGSTAIRNELVAVMDDLKERRFISEKEYTAINTMLSDF